MAFLVCVGFSVYGALQRLLYCVPAPLNAALANMEVTVELFLASRRRAWDCKGTA